MQNEKAKTFSDQIAASHGIIMKVCRLYGKDAEERNDLRQDILLNAWGSYEQFRGDSKFSTWLYRVALNTAIGRFRKRKIDQQPLEAFHHTFPDHENEKVEQLELLNQLIKHLTDHEKALVALYLDELSYEEIAEITGLTESHVGVKLNRIKQKLKTIVNHER